jgi:hypothetical protein
MNHFKSIILHVCFFSLQVFSGEPEETLSVQSEVASKELELVHLSSSSSATHHLNAIIDCSYDIATKQKGGKRGIEVASLILQKSRDNFDDTNKLYRLQEVCESYRHTLAKDDLDVELYGRMISTFKVSQGVKNLLSGFHSPKTSCSSLGGTGVFAILVSLQGSLDFGVCRATDGRRWLEVSSSGGVGVGGGVGVFGRYGSSVKSYSAWPIAVVLKWYANLAFGPGVLTEAQGQLSPSHTGIGFGAGGAIGVGLAFTFTALPLTSDYKYLRDRLFSDQTEV